MPSMADNPGIEGGVLDGENYWYRGLGRFESDKGYSSAGAPSIGATLARMNPIGAAAAGTTGDGDVISHLGTDWFAGSGNFYKATTLLGTPSGGKVMLVVGGVAVTAGLDRPSTGFSAAASGAASSKLNGSYSVVISGYRSTTGAFSTHSLASAVLTVKNKKITVTLPTGGNIPTGTTHWVIGGTRRGFGSSGPWYRITTIALTDIAAGTATVDVEWFDGELGELMPIDFDPSPGSVSFVAALGNCIIAIQNDGTIRPTYIGRPEAFPPGYTSRLASAEAPSAVKGRSTDGVIYVATANSLSAIIFSGNDITPVLPRGIWENTGFANSNSFCLVEDQIYGMAGSGPVRTQGGEAPDRTFADPVNKYFLANGWNSSNTVVVFAPDNNAVYFAKGTVCVPFMLAGAGAGRWSTPITIPSVTSGVTVGGTGYLSSGGTLYALDRSGGTAGTGRIRSAFRGDNVYKVLRYLRLAASGTGTAKVFGNLSTVSPIITQAHTGPHGSLGKYNQKAIRSYSFEYTAGGAGQVFYQAELDVLRERAHY